MPALSVGDAPCIGIVLGGAGAMGAYEVGVLSYFYEDVLAEIAGVKPTVFCGTSAGAINAVTLAAYADDPVIATSLLRREWSSLELASILDPSVVETLAMLLDVTGSAPRLRRSASRSTRGALFSNAGVAELVASIPFPALREHLASGLVRGVAVSATRVTDGGNTSFYEGSLQPRTKDDLRIRYVGSPLASVHVLASAAIPLLFPAVEIGGDLYCDGGLRQVVPLAPAIRLGARRLLVVNPLSSRARGTTSPSVVSPLFLAGKALNALFADRTETDVAHVAQLNAILEAGTARYGARFLDELNEQLALAGENAIEPVEIVRIEPTRDLGSLAATFVRDEMPRKHAGVVSSILLRIADGDPARAGDLLAFFLFDRGFTSALFDLGRSDARARHDELIAMVTREAPARTRPEQI